LLAISVLTGARTDFRKRFLSLLSFAFRDIASVNALSILEAASAAELASQRKPGASPAGAAQEIVSPSRSTHGRRGARGILAL
jgi:tRNA(Met) C34 N-acetyltransferase TmcA